MAPYGRVKLKYWHRQENAMNNCKYKNARKKRIYKHHKEPWFQLVIRIVSGSFVICFCVLSLIREVHITCVTTTCSHDRCHHADKALVVVLVVLFRLFVCHRVCLCVSVCVFVCFCLCIFVCVFVSVYVHFVIAWPMPWAWPSTCLVLTRSRFEWQNWVVN